MKRKSPEVVSGNEIVSSKPVVKKLEDYKQTKPPQLSLFEMLAPEDKSFSNTIELYDFIPKYHWGKTERIGGKFLDSLEREFECRGIKYTVKIRPASIEEEDGTERYYYPSKREELVEDALRKLATEGQGLFLDDEAGVTFSLYQLQEELKKNGHTYSIREIKDALYICARTNFTVTTEDNKGIISSNLFETLGLYTREDWKDKGKKSSAFVKFNSLVTRSIREYTFRQVNYEKVMNYRSVIARQLHKRMSHHYTQASLNTSYNMLLSSIIRDLGLTQYAQLPGNLRDVETSLEEMKENEVLLYYQIEKIIDGKKHSKLLDAKFILTPHPKFINDALKANGIIKKINAHI